jgi:hypothetical protein
MQFDFLVVVVDSLVLVLLLLVVVLEIGEMNEVCYALEIILPSLGRRLVLFCFYFCLSAPLIQISVEPEIERNAL